MQTTLKFEEYLRLTNLICRNLQSIFEFTEFDWDYHYDFVI